MKSFYLRHARSLQVAGLLLGLEVLIYWSYLIGFTAPNGDFMAHYLSDGYAWYAQGGVLQPPEWFSYTWMGRPAASNMQSSAYFLPVVVATLFHYYDPQVGATVAALVTGIGALGMYVLVRRLTRSHGAALLGLVAQFFTPIVFSNAQHQDFARGAALLPWLLLVASPLWSWHKRWGIPVAALIYWQYAIAAYPGQMAANLYAGAAWVIAWIIVTPGRRGWVPRTIGAGLLGLFMALAKFVPALITGTGDRGWEGQRSGLSPSILATIFYPYDDPGMPFDISVRPFFVVLPALLMLGAVVWTVKELRPVLAFGGVALILLVGSAVATSWVERLPGLGFSRFLVNDFKAPLVTAVILAAGFGAAEFLRGRRIPIPFMVGLVVVMAGLAVTLTPDGVATVMRVAPPFLIAGLAVLVVVLAARKRLTAHRLVAVLIAVAVLSGTFFAYSVRSPWASHRPGLERFYYGAPIADLVRDSECASAPRRPSRSLPEGDPTTWWHDTKPLVGAFTCELYIGGYANVPGNPVLRDQDSTFRTDSSGTWLRFFEAPGAVVPAPSGAPTVTDQCLIDGQCGDLTFTATGWNPNGEFSYRVTTRAPLTVLLNESFYPGWQAQICGDDGSCRPVEVRVGPTHSIEVDLPAGSSTLNLRYVTPYQSATRWLLLAALVAACATALVPPSRRKLAEPVDVG